MTTQMQEWLKKATAKERDQVAAEAGTSVGYLYQIAGGHRKPSLELSKKLQAASCGELTIQGLRPDLYQLLTDSKPKEAA
ncbi:transcriptional regulator with XRE-family HTH domain [Pseudomonas sp. GGS8]|uniref:hypothetical protein n=1 Tax=Pseudomonas sp. GGS8 TaxID=2817892 RepID=UPI00209F00C8|nr:hypothetical protein [Pseudomonas sp. GGS8]MCP1446421.1 transcriptional regulator with XRE-family HTH domain [Pseudomonas sp. GGS8]